MVEPLRGIIPIVYTPFDEVGNIDEEDVRRLVDHLIQAGTHGLAATGNASEAGKMTVEERKWLADVVIDQARGRVPVIVGTSAGDTDTAIELSRHAEQAGAKAVFVTPLPSRSNDAAVRAHFGAVARAVNIPIMVQHATIPLSVDQVVALSREFDNVRYVKEEALNVSGHLITEILARAEGRLEVFSGGQFLLDELNRGVVGAIPGSICVADLSTVYNLFRQGDRVGARRAYDHCLPLLYARRQAPLLWAKEVLRRDGVFKRPLMRLPNDQVMDDHDREELSWILETMGRPY